MPPASPVWPPSPRLVAILIAESLLSFDAGARQDLLHGDFLSAINGREAFREIDGLHCREHAVHAFLREATRVCARVIPCAADVVRRSHYHSHDCRAKLTGNTHPSLAVCASTIGAIGDYRASGGETGAGYGVFRRLVDGSMVVSEPARSDGVDEIVL